MTGASPITSAPFGGTKLKVAGGIGAFFDDEVHRYLGLNPTDGQVVYHFAIGRPVPDPRIEG